MRALLLVVACALPRERGGTKGAEGVFPHPGGFAAGASHGAAALARGNGACAACHDGRDPGATPCSDCHDTWPHPGGVLLGDVHGPLAWSAGFDACEACHAESGLAAASEAPCDRCHPSFPHPPSWEEAAQHGVYALERGSALAACGPCHGDGLEGSDRSGGTNPASACDACHATWPHAKGWATAHGTAALADASACAACHDREGVPGACSRCHPAWPHTAGWDHLRAAGTSGEGPCLTCHEAGDGPSSMIATCSPSCHGGAR